MSSCPIALSNVRLSRGCLAMRSIIVAPDGIGPFNGRRSGNRQAHPGFTFGMGGWRQWDVSAVLDDLYRSDELAAIKSKLDEYQAIFDTH